MKRVRKPYRRRHNLSRIKQDETYTYHEAGILLGVSKSTVRHWVKQGLPVMNAGRPPLIKGVELKAFLQRRQSKGKTRCQADEFYCLSCKAPRHVWENAVDVKAINERKLLLSGICDSCERSVSKIQPMKNAPKIADVFDVQQWHGGRIIQRIPPHLNCHIEEHDE